MAFVGEKFWKWNLKFSKFIKISFTQGHRKHTQNLFNAKFKLDLKHPKYNFFTEIRQQSKTDFLSKKPKIVLNTINDNFHNFVKIFYNDFRRNHILMMNLRVVWKRKKSALTDTGEVSKLVHGRKRSKVETLFSPFFRPPPSDEYDSAPSRK